MRLSRAEMELLDEAVALAARRDFDIIENHLFMAGRSLAAATERACRIRLAPETQQIATITRSVIDMSRHFQRMAEERVRAALKP